jgi:hypothetical protein
MVNFPAVHIARTDGADHPSIPAVAERQGNEDRAWSATVANCQKTRLDVRMGQIACQLVRLLEYGFSLMQADAMFPSFVTVSFIPVKSCNRCIVHGNSLAHCIYKR